MSDQEGRFSFDLSPGQYMLVTHTEGILPAPTHLTVSVMPGQVTDVQLLLDSGYPLMPPLALLSPALAFDKMRWNR
jgi:hypothetical protein